MNSFRHAGVGLQTSDPECPPDGGSKTKVLIVDDEESIRWALRRTLGTAGFDVICAETGEQALALVRTIQLDVVLLDISMPGMGGIAACKEIRKLMPFIGIVMLTVKDSEDAKIEALDAGADDYVTKPFHFRELAARLRSVARRSRAIQSDNGGLIRIGDVELDAARRLVKCSGEEIHLTPKEFDLLHYMMSHAGVSLAHSHLLAAVWGPEYRGEVEYLRTFVRQLRRKLGDDAAAPNIF
jgi:two-component system KDP operon response regulator KdpE